MESVSIVTIAYNPGEGLKRTLATIQQQSSGLDIECMIQDGGSTDGSVEILEEFRKKAGFPVEIVSGRDSGIYDAMNRAVARCTKDGVIFMNAGDAFASAGVLEKILKEETKKYDVIYGNAIMEDGADRSIWMADFNRIETGMPFCHQAALFRREIVKKFPFNIRYRSAADYDMLLRAYRSKCSFHNCNQTIAIFSMDGISSTKYVLAAKEKVDVLIRNGFLPENYTKTVAYKTKLMIARGKAVITQMVHDTPVEKALRAAYKKHVKHYRKI